LRALDHLEAWLKKGAPTDLRVEGAALAGEMRFIFRAGMFPLAVTYGGGDSGVALFTKTVKARLDKDPGADLTGEERSFVNTVLSTAWSSAVRRYGADPSVWHLKAIEQVQSEPMGYFASLNGYPSLDPEHDVKQPLLPVVDGATILSQRAQAYTQFVPLHDTDASLSILPFGISERPGSPFRFSTWADWSSGVLHPAPLSLEKVRPLTVRRQRLSALPPAPETPRRQTPDGEVLPGAPPSDPKLETMVRFLINESRTSDEVDAKLSEIRGHIREDSDLTAQAISVFRLVLYLEYGTDHARRKLKEAIGELGGELPPPRPEEYKRRQRERQSRRRQQSTQAPQSR
jgi:hypothetical protein